VGYRDPARRHTFQAMKLAMFGATGTVGSALVGKALAAGHELRVLARTPAKLTGTDPRLTGTDPRLTVIAGNAKDPAAVRRTVAGTDAVVSMLGGFADPDSIRIGTAVITAAMGDAGLRRVVIVQGFHLDFPGDPGNLGRKLILPMLRLGSRTLIADSRAMATAVRASGLDWTVVRTPRITRGESTGTARVGALAIGPWNSVVNADVADLVLGCLDDPATIGTAPMIASGSGRAGRAALGVLRTLHDIVRPPSSPRQTSSPRPPAHDADALLAEAARRPQPAIFT
jgi:uncharacterized protein YbjT (DUF2867 family)